MSGPIVRTGTTPKFWENWERAFGKKKQSSTSKTTAAKSAKAGGKATAKKAAKAVRKARKK